MKRATLILGAMVLVMVTGAAYAADTEDPVEFALKPVPGSVGVAEGRVPGVDDDGCIAGDGTSYAMLYFYDNSLLPLGRDITISDIASIEYHTKKVTDGTQPDWYITFYTDIDGVDDQSSWYGYRMNMEPYFSVNLDAPADQWNKWSTDAGDNQLRIMDSSTGYYGGYTDPVLADLQAGPAVCDGSTAKDYSGEVIKYMAVKTGTGWAAGFDGAFDDIKITLNDGSVLNVSAASGIPEVADGWSVFQIRAGSTTGAEALIADHDALQENSIEIGTTEGGQKVGLGTDLINGVNVSQIATLHIDRLDDVAASGSLWGPYFNVWVTDGAGNYAVIANEPSNPEWAGSRWDVSSWDFLKTKTCKVYETPGWNTGTSWLHTLVGKTSGLTFEDVADLVIAPPPASYIHDPANSVGSGAPDELGTSIARGFNWIFGDTAANYVTGGDGFVVNNYSATATYPVNNLTQGTGYLSLIAAVAAADAGDTIEIAAGTYTETGHLVIDKNLTVIGAGAESTILNPVYTSGGGGYAPENGWIAVADGVEFNLSGVTIDGADQAIKMAIISRGTLVVDGCVIQNIASHQYLGWGVCVLDGTDSVIRNSEFYNIQRIGVHVRGGVAGAGTTPQATVENCVFVGMGDGDWCQYAVEFGGGGSGTVTGCTISGYTGTALTDGSGSAGILATDYYGNGTVASVVSNTITGNSAGIMVGYADEDLTVLDASENLFVGNAVAVSSTPDASVEASANYFGSDDPDLDALLSGPVVCESIYADEALTLLLFLEVLVDDDFDGSTPNWGVSSFATVQDGVNAAAPGGVVTIAAGTYAEQVEIAKPLNLIGAGEDQTVIKGIADMPLFWTSSADNYPVVYLHDTSDVTIRNLTVDGDGQGNANYRYQGIALRNAGGTIEDVTVTGVSDTPFSGAQHGVSIYAYNTDGTDRNITVRRCTVPDFQKNAMALNGANAVVLVEDCDITGAGPTTVTAQNGIQLWDARGIVRNNSVSDIWWSGDSWVASGILVYDASDVIIEGNTITACQASIYATQNVGTPQNLQVTGNTVTGAEGSYIVGYHNVALQDNTFSACELAMNVYNTSQVTASGNHYDANAVGLWVDGSSSQVVVDGDTFSDNTDTALILDPAAATVSIANCSFTGNAQGLVNSTANAVITTRNYWGAEDGPSGEGVGAGDSISANCTYSPWWSDEAMTQLVYADTDDPTITEGMVIGAGEVVTIPGTMTVGTVDAPVALTVNGGTLNVGTLDLAEGSVVNVINGELVLGNGVDAQTISGTFTIYNSFGSIYIEEDTTFEGGTLALISDIHVAADVTLTVSGTLTFDGCVVNSQVPGTPFNIVVADTGIFNMIRTDLTDANITLNGDAGELRDNLLTDVTITVAADATANRILHNVFLANVVLNDNSSDTVTTLDGWGNVATLAETTNNLTVGLTLGSLADTRTLDVEGNLFIQPGDLVRINLDVSALNTKISGVDAMLGYNSDIFTNGSPSALGPVDPWAFVLHSLFSSDGVYGKIDAGVGLSVTFPDPAGTTNNGTVAAIDLGSKLDAVDGVTKFYFRTWQTNDNPAATTRLSGYDGTHDYELLPFTLNTGEITVDGTKPEIDSVTATQVQTGAGSVDVFDDALTRQGTVSFTVDAFDATAGIDTNDVVCTVTHVDTAGATLAVQTGTESVMEGELTWTRYTFEVLIDDDSPTGEYSVSVDATDRSGNVSDLLTDTFEFDRRVLVTVALQGAVAGPFTSDVTFFATDADGTVLAPLAGWTGPVEFINSTGTVTLADAPVGMAYLSAKTGFSLRRRVEATLEEEGQGAISFTGTGDEGNQLLGGDLNDDNVVNMSDFNRLRFHWYTENTEADIDGDGASAVGDLNILKANWNGAGDAQ